MLTVGLTGGIGSGKSTVARRLAEHGAVVIDADRVAREVLAWGTPGLRAVVTAFGPGVLAADGTLDRARLAALVFAGSPPAGAPPAGEPPAGADPHAARRRLNAIVHPLVRERTAALTAAAPPYAVIVNDVPLLVETGLAPAYHLVIVVEAPADQRIERLVRDRGMSAGDARARVSAQATDEQRRRSADVVVANDGERDSLISAVDRLWRDRLGPYADNLRERRPAAATVERVPYDPDWPRQYDRIADRLRHVIGDRRVDHVGATAVPGLAAADVIEVLVAVDPVDPVDPADAVDPVDPVDFVDSARPADGLRDVLADAGFPVVAGGPAGPTERGPAGAGGAMAEPGETSRLHASADPGRPARLHLREAGSAGWRTALLVRDWLRADPAAPAHPRSGSEQAPAPDPWSAAARRRAEHWAARTGWRPSGG